MKGTKDNRERIELPVAAEVMEREPSDGKPPALTLRPIENNGALPEMRKNVFVNILAPDGAVGINEENVAPAQAPPCPNGDVQTN